jgi:hypothetical protein
MSSMPPLPSILITVHIQRNTQPLPMMDAFSSSVKECLMIATELSVILGHNSARAQPHLDI